MNAKASLFIRDESRVATQWGQNRINLMQNYSGSGKPCMQYPGWNKLVWKTDVSPKKGISSSLGWKGEKWLSLLVWESSGSIFMLLPIWDYLKSKEMVFYCVVEHIWQLLKTKYLDWGSLWRERLNQFSGCKHDFSWKGLKCTSPKGKNWPWQDPGFHYARLPPLFFLDFVSLGKLWLEPIIDIPVTFTFFERLFLVHNLKQSWFGFVQYKDV